MSFNFIKIGVLSERELSYIVKEKEKYKNKTGKAGLVSLNGKDKSHYNETRRISDTYFPKIAEAPNTFNTIQSLVIQEYAETNLYVGDIPEIQYVRYPVGGLFDWHYDIIRKPDVNGRVRGLTLSLNITEETDYVGGNLLVEVSKGNVVTLGRKKGSYIIFPAFLKHKAETVESGTREAIVVWTKLTFDEINTIKKQHENNSRNNLLQ